jgi:hypothetical protein
MSSRIPQFQHCQLGSAQCGFAVQLIWCLRAFTVYYRGPVPYWKAFTRKLGYALTVGPASQQERART